MSDAQDILFDLQVKFNNLAVKAANELKDILSTAYMDEHVNSHYIEAKTLLEKGEKVLLSVLDLIENNYAILRYMANNSGA